MEGEKAGCLQEETESRRNSWESWASRPEECGGKVSRTGGALSLEGAEWGTVGSKASGWE